MTQRNFFQLQIITPMSTNTNYSAGSNQDSPENVAIKVRNYYRMNVQACQGGDIEPCTNEQCKKGIVAYHEILSGQFLRLRDPRAGSGKVYTSFEIESILNQTRCYDLVVAIDSTASENAAIRLKLLGLTSDQTANFFYFGQQLFDQILADNPVTFTFYRAFKTIQPGEQPTSIKDLIFSVQCPNGKKDRYFRGANIAEITPEPDDPQPEPIQTGQTSDKLERQGIARAHSIRVEVFERCLYNFWGQIPVPPAYVIVWNVMCEVLKNKDVVTDPNGDPIPAPITDPNMDRVALVWKTDDFSNNTLTGFSVKPADQVAELSANEIRTFYSVQLFKGMHDLGGEEFRFYKGKSDNGQLTILMEVISKDGSHGYADLSNDRP
jgi:hypothetical protein